MGLLERLALVALESLAAGIGMDREEKDREATCWALILAVKMDEAVSSVSAGKLDAA